MNSYKSSSYSSEKGLTLLEMSVVLVIVSLIAIGIFVGRDLKRNSEVMSAIKDLQNFHSAIQTFKDKYSYLPGDIPNAGDYWTNAAGTGTWNGDGDHTIDTRTEGFEAWCQLEMAQIIPEIYLACEGDTRSGGGGKSTPEYNIPKGDIDFSGYILYNTLAAPIFGNEGNFLRLGLDSTATNSHLEKPIFQGKEAWLIDNKIDDGQPDTGKILGHLTGTDGGSCVQNGYNDPNSGPYTTILDTKDCFITYILD